MWRLALKNTLARKGRLFLSAIGVIASCAFLSGVFVFSDTMTSSFDRLFANAYAGVDAHVRSSNVIEGDFGNDQRGRIPVTLVDAVAAAPGVTEAFGDVQGGAVITTVEGDEIGGGGPPQFGGAYIESEASPWALAEGRAPNGPTEVVIDRRSSKTGNIDVGDEVDITATLEVRRMTVVGIATFAGNDTSGGATWALFDLDTAMNLVVGEDGMVDAIQVRGDDSLTQEQVRQAVQSALAEAPDVEVLTGDEIIAESQDAIQEGLGFFTTFLTIFAGIATFVGCFIIYNIFKISAAQRLRETALLRAVGARSSQVVRSLLVEALLVGIVGGVLGFVGGVLLALVILALLNAVGFAPSDAPLTIQPDSFVQTLIVGVVVTVVCAVIPALRAGRTPPLAALRDVSIDRSARSKARLIVGIVAAVISAIGIAMGLSGATLMLIVGTLGLFVAIIAFGPLVVGPLAAALVRPLRKIRGVTGEIAARNAARSPERTALTAAALGICMALLVGVSTLGSSVITSFRNTINEQFEADISITTNNQDGQTGLPLTVLDEVLALPEVDTGYAFGGSNVIIERNGKEESIFLGVLDVEGASQLIAVPFAEGGWDDITGTTIGVSKDKAESDGLSVGDTIPARLVDGTELTLTVGAIYDTDFLGPYGGDRSLFDGTSAINFDGTILATGVDGISDDELKDAVTVVTDKYPTAKTQTRDEFIDSQVAQLGGFLNFIYALLGMSVFIAIIGVTITLLLSVYERRRELGLVRAVGMSRGQVRSSVRWESVVTGLLGTMMGVGLGVLLGWIVVKALEEDGINTFSVSMVSIVIFAVVAIVLSLVAAWRPASKAAKANILEAIATT